MSHLVKNTTNLIMCALIFVFILQNINYGNNTAEKASNEQEKWPTWH